MPKNWQGKKWGDDEVVTANFYAHHVYNETVSYYHASIQLTKINQRTFEANRSKLKKLVMKISREK